MVASGTWRACPSIVQWRAIGLWVAVVVTSVAPAAADPGFVWQAPASCPDAADVRARIERRLGVPLELQGVEVAIERVGAGFVARVDTRGVTVATDVRTLTSARCEELADAVAVIVARLANEAPREKIRQATDPEPAVRARAAPAPSPPPLSWGGGVRALAISGVGALPRVGVGGELAVYARRQDAFAELAVARWAADPDSLVDRAAPVVSLEVVGLRAGWNPAHMPLRAWLGGELGTLTGRGLGLAAPISGRWSAITSGFGVAWPMAKHARLVGTFEVAAVLSRERVFAAQTGEMFRPSGASARCALGLEVGWQ